MAEHIHRLGLRASVSHSKVHYDREAPHIAPFLGFHTSVYPTEYVERIQLRLDVFKHGEPWRSIPPEVGRGLLEVDMGVIRPVEPGHYRARATVQITPATGGTAFELVFEETVDVEEGNS